MKAILFDVDGVFLSEERCFDVSAITVAELLSSPDFLNCDIDIHFDGNLTENDINKIRRNVFNNDRILNQLKSLGLNSNSVSYTHLTLPTMSLVCRSRWSPYH